MSDSKPYSNRHKKRVVKEGLKKLKNKPGWDIDSRRKTDPRQRLRELDQQMRGHRVYEETTRCEACAQQRQTQDDDTALCDEHLAAAMGFE